MERFEAFSQVRAEVIVLWGEKGLRGKYPEELECGGS